MVSLRHQFTIAALVSVLCANSSMAQIRSGHNLLEDVKTDASVVPGSTIGAFAFKDIQGEAVYLSEAENDKLSVFVFMSTKCPLAKRYTMRLKRLHETYSKPGVQFFAVFPNSDETKQGTTVYAEEVAYPFQVVHDVNGYLAERLGATMTPQAFLVDRDMVLTCYR